MADKRQSRSGSESLPDTGAPPDPVINAYKKDIDRTLVRQSLRLSVEDRVRSLMAMGEFVAEAERRRKTAQ